MAFLLVFLAKLLSPVVIGLGFLAGFAVRRPLVIALSALLISGIDEAVMSTFSDDRHFEPIAFGIGAFSVLVWRHIGAYARRRWAERLAPRPPRPPQPDERKAP